MQIMESSDTKNITQELIRAILTMTLEQRQTRKQNELCHVIHCTFLMDESDDHNNSCYITGTTTNLSNGTKSNQDFSYWILMAKYVHLIIYPLFILMGIIGNCLSCLIMLMNVKRGGAYPASLYLTFLAFVDGLYLICSALPEWISQFYPQLNLKTISDFCCRFVYWFGNFTTHLSAGLVVGVTVERFIAVQYPLIAHKINTITRTRLAFVFLVLFFFLIDSPVFILVQHFEENIHTVHTCFNDTFVKYARHDIFRCDLTAQRYERTWLYIDFSVYTLIPFLIIVTLNSLIIRRLLDAQRFRQHMFRFHNRSLSRSEPVSESKQHRNLSESHQSIELMEKTSRYSRQFQSLPETKPLTLMLHPRLSQLEERRRQFSTKHSSISTDISTLSFELKTRSHHHHHYESPSIRYHKSLNRSRTNNTRLTILLLFVSCSFLILTLPAVVFNLILSMKPRTRTSILQNHQLIPIPTDVHDAETIFFYRLSRLMMIINHSINFILYLLLGKRFRRDLKQLFLNYWRKLCRQHYRRRRRRDRNSFQKASK